MTDLGLEHAAFRMVTEYLPAVNWHQLIKKGGIFRQGIFPSLVESFLIIG